MADRLQGLVMFWNKTRGVGSVVGDDGRLREVRRVEVGDAGDLAIGERVSFLADGGRYAIARNVRRLPAANPAPAEPCPHCGGTGRR